MSLDLRDRGSLAATVSSSSVMAADPWDAPYFGGRVYFHYPRFHAVAAAATLPPAELPTATMPEPAQSAGASALADRQTAPVAAPSAPAELPAPPRRGWLSRLLRRG